MIKLISQGNEEYLSEDGRVHVVRDHTFETWCDEPHPVRFGKAEKAHYRSLSDWDKRRLERENYDKYTALRDGKKGYLCPGNMEHNYSMWTSEVDDDWTEIVTDKFEETIGELEALLGEKIKVVAKRKPKIVETTVPDDILDRPVEYNPTHVGPYIQMYSAEQRLLAMAREGWADELRGIEEALVRYDELMASDDAPYVDQKLHEWHLKRKTELETMLA